MKPKKYTKKQTVTDLNKSTLKKPQQDQPVKKSSQDQPVKKPKYVPKYPQKSQQQKQKLPDAPIESNRITLPSKYVQKQKKVENESKLATKVNKNTEGSSWRPKYEEPGNQYQVESVKDLIDDGDTRKLKKYFLEVFQDADRIVLKYQIGRPSIIFQFLKYKQKQSRTLKELLKANVNFSRNKALIKRVYQSIYRSVGQKYYEIGYFGLLVADSRRIKFLDRNFKKNSKPQLVKQYPFYFAVKGEIINFILFDSALNSIQFNTKKILELKNKDPQSFEKYKQFEYGNLKKEGVEQMVAENFGQEEVDSDEQDRAKKIAKQKQASCPQIRRKIQKIINKDIDQFQQEIDKKDEHVKKLYQKNDNQQSKQLMEKLADEVMEQQATLDNFTETRDDVSIKISQNYSDAREEMKVLKSCLKRMILAEKQLISKLPIIARKRQIFQKLDKGNLLILEGETGSGKSTQLPQLLCQYYKIFQKENTLPVLITQPRKLATRSLAERVANEMEQTIHGFVDYQTSLTTKINQNAKIVFKMDRLVLDEIKVDPKLSKYCCLVIDEAHERTISIDVILGLIKKLLTLRNDFKIIVTSASMDTQLFRKYFNSEILKVSGRMFPVTEIYEPCQHEKDKTQKIIRVFNSKLLDDNERNLRPEYRGHVLVFCSGLDQIAYLCDYYKKKLNPRVFKVHPLHGKLSPEEQREVFTETQEYKIIFTTRIAETSITIDKVKVVIDPGEDRQMVYDQRTKVTTMRLKNISQSSAKQRAGRAGRTNEGYCFRLYTKKQKNELAANKTPQIQNMALDTVVLRLKSLDIQDIINFPYLSPPDKEGLTNSIEVMKMLKCLDEKTQKITAIGQFLVKIPIQPFLARAIIEAMLLETVITSNNDIFQCLKMSQQEIIELTEINLIDEVIRILCMLVNASNLFYIRAQDRDKADKTKFNKLSDESGDFFFLRKIYREFIKLYQSRDNGKLRRWAEDHYFSLKTLHQSRELERQITQIIKNFPINKQDLETELLGARIKITEARSVKEAILSCLVSSFATNLALYSRNQQIGYTVVSLKIPIQIYGSSILSLQGISPKWILYYDLYENEKGQMYCKIANQIDFDFLKRNANAYILKKFNVIQAQKFDPYYQRKVLKLPSLIFLNIASDFQKRFYQKQCQFLQQFSINFYEDRNELEFFYQVKDMLSTFIMSSIRKTMNFYLKKSDFRESKNPEEVIEGYVKEIQSRYQNCLKYNYVGPIFIQLKDGFDLANIDLKNTQHVFRISSPQQSIDFIIYYCQNFGDYEQYPGVLVFKIVQDEDVGPFKRTLNTLIQHFTANNYKVTYEQELQDRRKKIPQAKLFIHFWTGQVAKNNIYLDYSRNQVLEKQQDKQKWMTEMVECLNKFKNEHGRRNQFSTCTFQLAKKLKGINCFQRGSNYDQIQLFQIMEKYNNKRQFGFHFQMPTYIKKFREPDLHLGSRKQKDWEDEINELLISQKFPVDKAVVKVWGQNYYPSNKDVSAFEKTLKVEWHAEIKSFDVILLQKLRQKYNKKEKILGTEKAHFKTQFEQTAAVTTLSAFKALEDDYLQLINQVRLENPRVSVEYFQKTFKKLTKVFIKIRCQNRDQMIRPTLKLNNLFRPKIIPLTADKFRFLDKLDEGNDVLSVIQQEYKYKIYFAFDRKTFSLKLYCEDFIFKQIMDKLTQRMLKFKLYEKEISYRGKNLHKVKQLIEAKIAEIKRNNDRSKFLNYEIIFKYRKVKLMGDLISCDEAQNQIMKIINKEKEQCTICCDLLQKPYRLYVCSHEFCWVCLSSYIRESINNPVPDLLRCPGCPVSISVYDVQKIMSDDEFNRLCDLQIARYIDKHPKFHGCPSANCQNIFQTEQSKKNGSYQCDLCGKWYCFKCKESHKGYNCQDWKFKMDDSSLKKLGIKKCPSCGEGIEKNLGCQHVTCIKCKIHICWNCLKTFKEGKDCYDHLAKSCGGIFLPNAQ